MTTLSDTPAGNPAEVPLYEARTLYQVPVDRVLPDPNQPRKSFDAQALEEMVASVAKHGIIQPVIFRRGPDGTAIVVAGERRVAAARKVGLTEIPGIFSDGNAAEIALVENLQRQDLTPIEEAEGLQALMTEQKYTQEQLGGIIGKARNTLSEILSLNKLPQDVRDDCRGDRTISKDALITIAKKKQDRSMTTAYIAYKAKLQKGKTPRKKKDPNEPQTVFDMMDKALTKIRSIDMSAWTDDDRENFRISIASLKTEIDNYLSAPPSAAPASKNLA
ncbi:MAG: ParB/RepB/Spo0J family partition protein [Deltaproteobacteria bacterium]|nr:MAG: ParB/RepB/Spo0J family partition protein [Deltaproteobacteria bacterium]